MEFLKQHWSTLALISIVAVYLGISMGTQQCPLCIVAGSLNKETGPAIASSGETEIIGQSEPIAWEAKSLNGATLSSEKAQGKVAVLVYWATWCGPCRKEIPSIVALRDAFSSDAVEIIGISVDEPKRKLGSFVEEHGVNYEIARHNESLEEAFGPVRYIPTIFIVDKEGAVQYRHTGVIGEQVLREQISSLL